MFLLLRRFPKATWCAYWTREPSTLTSHRAVKFFLELLLERLQQIWQVECGNLHKKHSTEPSVHTCPINGERLKYDFLTLFLLTFQRQHNTARFGIFDFPFLCCVCVLASPKYMIDWYERHQLKIFLWTVWATEMDITENNSSIVPVVSQWPVPNNSC